MFFKKIEMQGFKSFAEPVTIEFHEGITCVVGPNGSGKSNISDAIRWVLGEQSAKMLRGARMDEVIFSGSAGRKSRGMAEVTLTIDNSDGSLDIDFQEVALTRRMYRTGESEYFINKSQCRLRDIRELIMDTGIGVDGYSIIGQGRISDIISNKTENRREIFEEAAGIVAYRSRKVESERKLESTRANMDRVLDIIAEIDRKLPGLQQDSVKAEEYLKLRERNRELEINIVLRNIEKLQLNEEYMKDDRMELQMALENVRETRKAAEEAQHDASRKNEELEKLSAQTQAELVRAIEELNTITNQAELDKERVAYIDRTTQDLRDEAQLAEDKLRREKNNRKQLESGRKEADRELTALRADLSDRLAGYTEMSEDLAAMMTQVDDCRNKVFETTSRISSAKAEISSLEMLRETLDRRQQAILTRKESGAESNRDTIDQLNKLKAEHRQQSENIEEQKELQAGILKDVILLKADVTRLTAESEDLRIQSGQLTARARTLKELEENYDGYNHGVKHVMRSSLRGIHGVVADLITVPAEYTTAIETALGGSLQNVVCEDDRSAREAILSLKRNKAGRVTFLPVGSVRGKARRDGKAESAEGFVGFGPDLVQADSKYDEILAYLLGRVVVVDDMDHAIAMSKQVSGYRFVTLDGEVISESGAITGGQYKHKTANLLDRKAEINELEKDLEVKTKRIDQIGDELQEAERALEEKQSRSEELDASIRTATYEFIEKENEIKMAESALRDLKSDAERLDQELKGIEEERARSKAMVADLHEQITAAEAEKQEAELQGEKKLEEYQQSKSSFDAVSDEITAARLRVNSCENQMEHMDEMVARSEEILEETKEEIRSRKEKIEQLKDEREQLTSGHEDMDGLVSAKEKERNLLQGYLEEIQEEKAQVTKAITEASEEKDQADQKLTDLQEQKYQLDVRQARNETQLENFKERLWEDFEVSYAQALDMRKEDFALSSAVRENRTIKNRMKELGEVNVGAIAEYKEEKKRYDFLTEQRDDIQQAMDAITGIIEDLDQTIKTRFKDSFDRIVINFEEKFQELFGGGHVELRLSDEEDPLGSDIDIIAQPPGKKLQNINLLSGGEKTLTAIALMFAVLAAKPTPFCILDEVEAALDDANIERFISCLRSLEGIQFTLVTHQKATMEHADVLYGVTMPEKGVSKVLSLDLGSDLAIPEI